MSADSKDGATSAGAGTGASTPHKHKAETGNDRAGNVNSIGGIRLLLSDGNGGPAKKKRKTRQHVQPDDLIHPTVHSYGLPDDYLHHAAAASAMTASNATANNNTDASANAAAMDITVPSQPAITAISPSSSSTDGAAEPASSPAALLRSPAFTRSSSPLPRTGSTSHLTVSVDPNAAQSAAASPSGKADKPKKQTKKQKEQQQKQLRKEKAAAKAAAAAATMQQPSSTATTAATATTSSSSTQSSTASTSSSSSTTTATDKKGFRAQDKAKAAAEGAELQAKKKTSGLDAKVRGLIHSSFCLFDGSID